SRIFLSEFQPAVDDRPFLVERVDGAGDDHGRADSTKVFQQFGKLARARRQGLQTVETQVAGYPNPVARYARVDQPALEDVVGRVPVAQGLVEHSSEPPVFQVVKA